MIFILNENRTFKNTQASFEVGFMTIITYGTQNFYNINFKQWAYEEHQPWAAMMDTQEEVKQINTQYIL